MQDTDTTAGPGPATQEPAISDLADLVALEPDIDVQMDIDEMVHDAAEEDESIDTYEVVEEGEMRDLRSLWASELNNQGLGAQLEYLDSRGLDIAAVARALLPAAISSHARLTLRSLIGD